MNVHNFLKDLNLSNEAINQLENICYLEDYSVRVTQGKGYNEITVYVILLSTLFCLHVFWICLFIKIGLKYAKRGVIHDSQETKRSEYSDPDTDSD